MRGRNTALIRRFHPTYRSPKLVYQEILDEYATREAVWLDLGCGKRLCAEERLNRELPRRVRLVVGADRAARLGSHESIVHLVRCDATELPFKAGTFNLVTAAMVFEHLERPSETMKEIARACRPGAHLVVFTPNRFNYAMLVAASTPHRFHVLYKRLTHYLSRGEWKSFEDDVFPTWYRANSVRRLRRLAEEAGFSEKRLQRLSLAHSFGFVRPLYACSLLFERVIDRPVLEILKADILAIFVRGPV